MNENDQVEQILEQAKIIRERNRTSCVELQNYLYYQYLKLNEKGSALWACGLCTRPKAQTKKQFRRAFKTLSRVQQAQFYLMNMKNVQRFLNTRIKNNQVDQTQVIQQPNSINQSIIKIKFQIMDGNLYKKYTPVSAEILNRQKIIRIVDRKQDIDLHAYIMRKSQSKSRNSVVLESMEAYTGSETVRIVFSSIDFEDSFNIIAKVWNQAQYENIKKILIEDNKFPRRINNRKLKDIKEIELIEELQPITSRLSYKNGDAQDGQKLRESIEQIQKTTPSTLFKSTALSKIQKTLVSPQLILSLNTFKNFQQQSFGVFFDKTGTKVRKVFQFNIKTTTIDMIKQSIDNIKHIKRRKPSIINISHLNSIPSERTNLYRQVNIFENIQYEFLYFRHYFNQNNAGFYFEKSIDLEEFKNNNGKIVKSVINYCIWRIMKVGDKIELLVEADITYSKKVTNMQKITAFYIGEFENFVDNEKEMNKEEIENDNISLGSKEFENQYLSQISDREQDFFTATGSLDEDNGFGQNDINQNDLNGKVNTVNGFKKAFKPLVKQTSLVDGCPV